VSLETCCFAGHSILLPPVIFRTTDVHLNWEREPFDCVSLETLLIFSETESRGLRLQVDLLTVLSDSADSLRLFFDF
jgi:hypothetical protein